jgi:erythromycin esterase
MGGHLRECYGDAYYALGMEFSGGRFVARKQQYGSAGTRLSMAAEAPPNGSLLDAFDATDRALFALDFASIENGDLRDWLARDHALHVVGGATPLDAGWAEHTTEGSPTEQYDGVIFVGESSPTRPLGVDVRTPLG